MTNWEERLKDWVEGALVIGGFTLTLGFIGALIGYVLLLLGGNQ